MQVGSASAHGADSSRLEHVQVGSASAQGADSSRLEHVVVVHAGGFRQCAGR